MQNAIVHKYLNAAKEWSWQYVLSSPTLSIDARSGRKGRHHLSEDCIQRAMKQAVKETRIRKHATPYTLHHIAITE